jgi:hypothetical protein
MRMCVPLTLNPSIYLSNSLFQETSRNIRKPTWGVRGEKQGEASSLSLQLAGGLHLALLQQVQAGREGRGG